MLMDMVIGHVRIVVGVQVVWLQHNDILDQLLDDGWLRGRREQHADPRGGLVEVSRRTH